jgi:WD40 repeat protein
LHSACDDGTIQLWRVPEGGLTQPTNEAEAVLSGHAEKIYFLKFHPLARDIIATGSFDMTVRIWDLKEGVEKLQLEGHTDQVKIHQTIRPYSCNTNSLSIRFSALHGAHAANFAPPCAKIQN